MHEVFRKATELQVDAEPQVVIAAFDSDVYILRCAAEIDLKVASGAPNSWLACEARATLGAISARLVGVASIPHRLDDGLAGLAYIDAQSIQHLNPDSLTLADQTQQHVLWTDVAITVLR